MSVWASPKTSCSFFFCSPGSGVVTYYLEESGVIPYLDTLGFGVVGYYIIDYCSNIPRRSCTPYTILTGVSWVNDPMPEKFWQPQVRLHDLYRQLWSTTWTCCWCCWSRRSCLRRRPFWQQVAPWFAACRWEMCLRNFEGRIHPHTRANYLASPLFVIAYAIAGRVDIDFETEPLATLDDGKEVCIHLIWDAMAFPL